MARTVHIIGNGDQAVRYKPQKGTKITCNLPPFSVEGVYATCLVDFKIMHAMHMGEIAIPGDWILGFTDPRLFYRETKVCSNTY